MKAKKTLHYPPIPDKRFFPIGEAAKLAATKTPALRYWEKEIPALQKVARRGGRRYYTPQDIMLLRKINNLIRDDSCTVGGVRQRLLAAEKPAATSRASDIRREIMQIIKLL